MAKSEYSELLKDPRWQKKRLKIFNRDKFTCRVCFAKEKTLHLHHLEYTTSLPWDEPDDNLRTICCDCHKNLHDVVFMKKMKEYLVNWISENPYHLLCADNSIRNRPKQAQKHTKQKIG